MRRHHRLPTLLPTLASAACASATVAAVTDVNGDDCVAPAERIAVFDNDGTLWVEQPMYTPLAFAIVVLVRAVTRMQKPAEAAPAAPTERDCPECLSAVPIQARPCRFCTTALPAAP